MALGYSLSCCHPKRYLKQRETHKKLPAQFPPSPEVLAYTVAWSRGLTGLGLCLNA